MKRPQLTLLSSILGPDFHRALQCQSALGLRFLDLKDGLWGQSIEEISGETAEHAASLLEEFGLEVHCFSTSIGGAPLSDEAAFRARFEPALENVLRAAKILRPQVIRLLAPRLTARNGEIAVARLLREFPWLIGIYRAWVDRITTAGCGVLIENEAQGCALASVNDISLFFAALERPKARFTWDVQNLWQNGVFPSLEIYRQLEPLIGAVHLKGGRADENGALKWAAPLDEASWPVLEIVRAVVTDGAASFICLNPSHGEKPAGWDNWQVAQREIAWLRREIEEFV